MITTEEYIANLDMSLDEAKRFLSDVEEGKGCACVGCPPGVSCRSWVCRCSLLHTAATRIVLKDRAAQRRAEKSA